MGCPQTLPVLLPHICGVVSSLVVWTYSLFSMGQDSMTTTLCGSLIFFFSVTGESQGRRTLEPFPTPGDWSWEEIRSWADQRGVRTFVWGHGHVSVCSRGTFFTVPSSSAWEEILVLQRVQPSSWADGVPCSGTGLRSSDANSDFLWVEDTAGRWLEPEQERSRGWASSRVSTAWLASVEPQSPSSTLLLLSQQALWLSLGTLSCCTHNVLGLYIFGERKDFHKGVRGHVSWKEPRSMFLGNLKFWIW